ncbi:cytochrome c-type biogenesis protein CcmE [Modestobacter sp. DSM 44400]|uniref:cytochrome c maturation protein CcmE n=1 Tax=Modestobacter sp. DSM 44400 TaxID=1550230 RepID=UPI00089D33E5|nr:cytochrome c maturation protein CcmE [Modestobacter sp. DSM 44400]SDY66169.1 cytochrome c-type biogenesis protein CcmE [Modestobacter sp. DSM 44400]
MTATVPNIGTPDNPPAAGSTGTRRWRLVVVVVVVLGAVAILAVAGLNRTLVYYRTPTELLHDQTLVGKQVRVGGLVAPGSLQRDGQVARFTLTDGVTDVPVVFTGPINGVFAAGRDALVDGRYTSAGVLDGDELIVKHDNTYRGPDGKRYTPPTIGAAPAGTGRGGR